MLATHRTLSKRALLRNTSLADGLQLATNACDDIFVEVKQLQAPAVLLTLKGLCGFVLDFEATSTQLKLAGQKG